MGYFFWYQIPILLTILDKSTLFIFQAMSMAVQWGNVQCVQGACGESAFEEHDEIFYIVQTNNIFFLKLILTCQHS